MKFLFIPLIVTCLCRIISTESDVRIKVTIIGPEKVSVDFLEKRQLVFQCLATSDPSTNTTVRWYKTEPYGDLVHDEPPYVYVKNESLNINIDPKCSSACTKYLGEYRCTGDNGYSQENRTITLSYEHASSPEAGVNREADNIQTALKILLGAGAVGLVLLIIGILLPSRLNQGPDEVDRRIKGRRLPNLPRTHEHAAYETVDYPWETAAFNDRWTRTQSGEYERFGYESVKHVHADTARRDRATQHPSCFDGYNPYDYVGAPQRKGTSRARPVLDGHVIYDEIGLTIHTQEVKDEVQLQGQKHSEVHETVQSDSGIFSRSGKRSGKLNSYSDHNRKEVDDGFDVEKSNLNPGETNLYIELVSSEENPYLDMVPKEVTPCADLDQNELNPYVEVGQKRCERF